MESNKTNDSFLHNKRIELIFFNALVPPALFDDAHTHTHSTHSHSIPFSVMQEEGILLRVFSEHAFSRAATIGAQTCAHTHSDRGLKLPHCEPSGPGNIAKKIES